MSNARTAAKASQLIRARMVGNPRAPLATRGFFGPQSGRGPELKFLDTTAINQAVAATWTVIAVNLVLQGTDYTQRIGRKICMKSVLLNGNFFNSQTVNFNGSQGSYNRVALIYDTQPNGSATVPVGTDIFATSDPNSPLNLNNRDRFKVIMEKRGQIGAYTMNATPGLASGSPNNIYFSKWKKLNHEVIFNSTTATIGGVSTGSLLLCYINDAANSSVFDYYVRVRFSDN